MADYPTSPTARARERKRLRDEVMARAERDASALGCSTKCGAWRLHAPEGCQNDGSNCICECHDGA